jgi:hypothetical protein
MSDVRPIPSFTMLPGAGPACEGDDCPPSTVGVPQQADPTAAGS